MIYINLKRIVGSINFSESFPCTDYHGFIDPTDPRNFNQFVFLELKSRTLSSCGGGWSDYFYDSDDVITGDELIYTIQWFESYA